MFKCRTFTSLGEKSEDSKILTNHFMSFVAAAGPVLQAVQETPTFKRLMILGKDGRDGGVPGLRHGGIAMANLLGFWKIFLFNYVWSITGKFFFYHQRGSFFPCFSSSFLQVLEFCRCWPHDCVILTIQKNTVQCNVQGSPFVGVCPGGELLTSSQWDVGCSDQRQEFKSSKSANPYNVAGP